jgi:Zn-dependent oligopeptidase
LSRGQTDEVATLYRNFRGREPDVKYLIIERGLNEPVEPGK